MAGPGDHDDAPSVEPDEADTPAPTQKKGFFRRHAFLTAFLALVLVLLVAVGGFAFLLNRSLGNLERVPVTIPSESRPAPDPIEKDMNILLLGADAGQKRNPGENSILEDAASGKWPTGKYRSDATMLVHISADRKSAYIASIPRDSYVPIYDGQGKKRSTEKINAALSLYGPSGAISTVEHLTNLRIDHLAMVDWDGFEGITNALGGVTITDEKGTRKLDGEEALAYVRDRFNVPRGDFDRVRRHQNFLRAVMLETMDRGTLLNPFKLRSTLTSFTKNMAVDDGWSNGSIRSLALSMRGIRPSDVTFMTIPTNGTSNHPTVGSIVNVDYEASNELFNAMREDDVRRFVEEHPELLLGNPKNVA